MIMWVSILGYQLKKLWVLAGHLEQSALDHQRTQEISYYKQCNTISIGLRCGTNSVVKIMGLEGAAKSTLQRIHKHEKTKAVHSGCKFGRKLSVELGHHRLPEGWIHCLESHSILNCAGDEMGNGSAR